MKHRRAWCRFWCAYANNNGITNFFAYNMYEGCACLEAVHQRAEQLAKEKGAKAQHASFKEARAAMSAFWGLVHPDTNFAEVRAVKAMAKGLRRVAPLKAKHADTWDIQLVFDKLFELARRGIRVVDMDHDKMRGWLALMIKIKTAGRSGDVGFVRSGDRGGLYRGFYPRDTNKMRCGLRGDWLEPHVTHVRWYMNKTVAGQADDYSPWHPLGDHLEDSRAFPFLSAACPRRMLEAYLDKTDTLPRSDDLVLISSVKKDGRYFGITAQTVANDVGAVMTVCGVAARFNAHTTRHASLSKRRAGGASIDDIVGSANISAKVFKNFYNRPIDKAAAAPPPSLGGKGTRRLAPARAMALTTSKRPSSAIVVSKKTKKKKKIQQKKIEPAAPPAAAAACVIDIVLRDEPVYATRATPTTSRRTSAPRPGATGRCVSPAAVFGALLLSRRLRRPPFQRPSHGATRQLQGSRHRHRRRRCTTSTSCSTSPTPARTRPARSTVFGGWATAKTTTRGSPRPSLMARPRSSTPSVTPARWTPRSPRGDWPRAHRAVLQPSRPRHLIVTRLGSLRPLRLG